MKNPQNRSWWWTYAAAVVGGILIWMVLLRASERRNALMAEERARHVRLHAEMRRIDEWVASAELRCAELTVAIRTHEAAGALPLTPRPQAPTFSELFERDPKLRELWANRQRAVINSSYGPVFEVLNFSPEEKAAFFSIFLEYEERSSDVFGSARSQDMDPANPAIAALLEEEKKRWWDALVARFGARRVAHLREFERKERPRQFVAGLVTAVAYTHPLTPVQAERLTQIVAEATPAYRAGKAADNAAIEWAEVDRKAQAVLSPAQYAAWMHGDPRQPGFSSRLEMELEAAYKRAVEVEKSKAAESKRPKID